MKTDQNNAPTHPPLKKRKNHNHNSHPNGALIAATNKVYIKPQHTDHHLTASISICLTRETVRFLVTFVSPAGCVL